MLLHVQLMIWINREISTGNKMPCDSLTSTESVISTLNSMFTSLNVLGMTQDQI